MKTIESKIQEILNRGSDLPNHFRLALMKKSVFTQNEEILDVVYLEREYINDMKDSDNIYSNAKLIVATSYGITLLEERNDEFNTSISGISIKHILYGKINTIQIDYDLLSGVLRINVDTNCGTETGVEFIRTKEGHIEFDNQHLQGTDKIFAETDSCNETTVEFNTSKYGRDFEEFIQVVRNKLLVLSTLKCD